MISLIQPVRIGGPLLNEIRQANPAAGAVQVWWLGQSGYLIKGRSGTLLVDPYLSESLTRKYAATDRPHVRMTAAPLGGQDLDMVDLVLVSHKHSDHMDPETLPQVMKASPGADLIYPVALSSHLGTFGIDPDRCIGVDAGDLHIRAGISIRSIASAHEGLDTDQEGRHLYLGYVIEIDGVRIYHSGDSLAYPGLEAALGADRFDVLLLPINGRDPGRGVSGNMSAAEAVDLANRVRPRFVVPHHYDMFTFNTVPVQTFETEARRLSPEIEARVLKCCERWEVGSWA